MSTHHQYLKSLLHRDDHYLSAHVGIDSETKKPTYKIQYEGPGSSMAFTIFETLLENYPSARNLLSFAQSYKDENSLNYENLIAKLNEKVSLIEKERRELAQKQNDVENAKNKIEGEWRLKFETQAGEFKAKFKKKVEKLDKLINELRSGESKSSKHYLKQKSEIGKEIEEIIPTKEGEKVFRKPEVIHPGHRYFSKDLGVEVLVQSLKGKKAIIGMGVMKKEIPIDDLYLSTNSSTHKKPESSNTYSLGHYTDIGTEFDARGYRLEEFQEKIDRIKNALLLESVPYVTVIHGHGEGVLKAWLRNEFKRSEDFSLSIDEHSADGSSTLKLK
jgi:DNA mismatch repair protein MutS2